MSGLAQAIEILCDNYGKELNEAQTQIWMDVLTDYSDSQLHRACVACIKTSKWMPKLSELVDLCNREKDIDDTKMAWARAMELFNASMRGDITEAQLESDSSWRWYKQQIKAARPINDDAIWEQSCAEVAQWMAEDE